MPMFERLSEQEQIDDMRQQLKNAAPGGVITIPEGANYQTVKQVLEEHRHKDIDQTSKAIAEEIAILVQKLVQNELRRQT